MSSTQPKIIKFGWDFTKLYQFNIKQMEMCSFLGHPVVFRVSGRFSSMVSIDENCRPGGK